MDAAINAINSAPSQVQLADEDDGEVRPPSSKSSMMYRVASMLRPPFPHYGSSSYSNNSSQPQLSATGAAEITSQEMVELELQLPYQALAAARQAAAAVAGSSSVPPLPDPNSSASEILKPPTTIPSRQDIETGGVGQAASMKSDLIPGIPVATMPPVEEEELQCAICLCEFEEGDSLMQLPCEHDFHGECINGWMKQHRTCPLCRFILFVPPPQPEGQASGSVPPPAQREGIPQTGPPQTGPQQAPNTSPPHTQTPAPAGR
jgi:hypothetical protein